MRAHLAILLTLAFSWTAAAGEDPAAADRAKAEEARKLMDSMAAEPRPDRPPVDARLLSRAHFETGKRLYDALLYEEARKELERAALLDPANEDAKELLRKTEAMLDMRLARVKAMVQGLNAEESARRQEELVRLQTHWDRARVLVAKATAGGSSRDAKALGEQVKQLEEAEANLVRAREIAKWMPAPVPVKEFEDSIASLMEQVYKERKQRELVLMELGRERAEDEALALRASEERERQRRIRMLLDKADMLYDRRDYDEAGRLARRVLEIDPTSGEAISLETSCRWRSIDKRKARTDYLKGEAIKDWLDLSKQAMVPWSPLLVYPDNWNEISRREGPGVQNIEEPDWKRDIRAALEKNIPSIEFLDQPLDECIRFLQGLTDVNIIPDQTVFVAGGPGERRITLRLSNTKLGIALRWILKMASVDYSLKDGAIFISTPDKLQGELVQRVYDVRDLTHTIPNFEAPEFGLAAGGAGGVNIGGAPVEVAITQEATLKDMIQRVIRPGTWGVNGTSLDDSKKGQIIINHQPEVHLMVSRLLENFRKSQTIQVHVEARYLDVTQGFLQEIGMDWGVRPGVGWTGLNNSFDGDHPTAAGSDPGIYDINEGRPNGAPGQIETMLGSWANYRDRSTRLGNDLWDVGEGLNVLWTYLGNFQAQALLKAVKKEQRGSVLFAPRLTLFNNQRAYMMVAKQQSYVSAWTSSGDVYTPTVSTGIFDGVALDVRPIVSHDRKYITLELRPTLVRPINLARTVTTNANDEDLETLLPETEIRTIRTVVTVPDGGTVLLSGLMDEKKVDVRMGIPFLHDLPILAPLFGTDYKDTERRNLLILVTSRLLLFSEEEQKL